MARYHYSGGELVVANLNVRPSPSHKRASSKQSLEKSEGHCRNDALENWLGQVAVEKVLDNVVQLNLRLTTVAGISNQ